jgi:lambda family phage minor tail protein L
MAVPVSALQEINPGAVIELFELELNTAQHGVTDVYRFHSGVNLQAGGLLIAEDSDLLLFENGDMIAQEIGGLIWNGNSYSWFPIQADGFELSGNGQLPRPTLRMSNLLGTITGLMLSLPRGLEGAKVTRIRTLGRYIDADNFPGGVSPYSPDPTAEFPRQVFYIDRKAAETRDVVEFELASAFDLFGVRGPKRQCLSAFCQWEYRSTECGYSGDLYFDEDDVPVATLAEDVCGKRLSSCERRFAQIIGTGSVTSGSNQLVLESAVNVKAGLPIKGFAVPSGTTVSSVAGATITMSANATATTTISKTGTLSTNRTTITGINTSGLAVGMIVTGGGIPAGVSVTVESVGATTVTLSQQLSWLNVATLITTKTSSYLKQQAFGYAANPRDPDPVGDVIVVPNTTSIALGQYVIGPTIAEADTATVTGILGNSGTLKRVLLSFNAKIANSTGSYSFYEVQTQASATYTFTAPDRSYVFRTDGILNFGSFPGVSNYVA